MGEETFVTPLVAAGARPRRPLRDQLERKLWNLYSHLYSTPPRGDPVRILQRWLVLEKLEWWGKHILKKVWWYRRYN